MLNAWTGLLQQTKLTAFRQISLALVLNVTIDFTCNCPKENYFITFYVEYPVSILYSAAPYNKPLVSN